MNAIVVGGAQRGPAALIARPDPAASPGGCVVRVRAALVLPADLRPSLRPMPRIPGSAFVGTVEAVAAEDPVTVAGSGPLRDPRALIGRRVAVHPVVRCGRCDRCLAGLSQHCRERAVLGEELDGGLAERVAVPLANLVALPDGLDDERAAFAVPVAQAIEATRQVKVEGKAYITVLGDDLLALVIAQVMARLNAAVRIVGRSSTTIAAAEKLGVKHRMADEVGRRGDQDVVVDAVGGAESLAFASQLVRARGAVILVAAAAAETAVASPTGVDLSPIVRNELRVHGSWFGPLGEAVDLLARRAIEVVSLAERRTALADALPLRVGTLVRP